MYNESKNNNLRQNLLEERDSLDQLRSDKVNNYQITLLLFKKVFQ